jgi:hypothetical protein
MRVENDLSFESTPMNVPVGGVAIVIAVVDVDERGGNSRPRG